MAKELDGDWRPLVGDERAQRRRRADDSEDGVGEGVKRAKGEDADVGPGGDPMEEDSDRWGGELGYFQPLRLGLDLGGPRRTTPRRGEDPSIRGGRVTLSWVARAALECVLQRVWVWEGGSYFYV